MPPAGYLGAQARINSGPAPELVAAGYALELADAPLLHDGLTLADLAHVIALSDAGVLPDDACRPLLSELLAIRDTPAEEFPYDPIYGDAYNSRERELVRRLGDRAGWLHTGRTRREAGRIAFRLGLRAQLTDLQATVAAFVDSVLGRSRQFAGSLWNDTTYLQPAQPSTFGHYLLGFAEEAVRHLGRIDISIDWTDRSPAGVGGVSGTRIPVERRHLAALLGFADLGEHTRDVMWSTDGLVDAVVAATQAVNTVDRLAEDFEVFATPQFGYLQLDASVCRASVMLPQKRNPYALAVIRGGANTIIGRAVGLMAAQRTPSARTDNWLYAYGEVSGAIMLARRLVSLAGTVVDGVVVDVDRMAASAGDDFTCATDLTDELVLQTGLDYRRAYKIVGAAASQGYEQHRTRFDETDLEGIAAAASAFGASIDAGGLAAASRAEAIVATRTQPGGSAPETVLARCRELSEVVKGHREQIDARRARYRHAEQELITRAQAMSRRDDR